MRSLAALGLAFATSVMPTHASDIEHGEFYPLSKEDVELVETTVSQSPKATGEFSGIQATRTGAGLVNVCGFVTSRNGDARSPFIGAMPAGGPFKLLMFGTSSATNADVIARCQRAGIVL